MGVTSLPVLRESRVIAELLLIVPSMVAAHPGDDGVPGERCARQAHSPASGLFATAGA